MKILSTKLDFHYTFLVLSLGLVLTGHFSNLLIFTSLILVHEFGHVIAAILFKYDVDKVIIFPYGGLTKLNTLINTNVYKDLVVAIFGVFFQSLYFLIIYFLYSNGMIREYVYNLFFLYHKSMLFFNLLPIVPLDGFKILNLFLSKYFNFNLSNNLSVFISLCTIIVFLFSNMFEKNYSIILVLGILMQNIYKFYNNISFVYNRFLVERYIYNINYRKKRIIKNVNNMYKNCSHFFVSNGRIISEKSFLVSFFKK